MSKTDAADAKIKGYEPSRRLAGFHIRGFQHWDGALGLLHGGMHRSICLNAIML